MYRYEMHLHTMESSSCGHMYAEDIVDYYHREGYQGIVVTDHFHEQFFQGLPEYKKDWAACVDHYLKGYRAAVKRAAPLDFDVILGIELRCPDNMRDTLVYGVDEEFLYKNEYSYELGLEEFFRRFGSERLIIAAHPFRRDRKTDEWGGVLPEYIHGAEVINCNPRHNSHNDQTLEFCRSHPEFVRVCGSDTHRPVDLCAAYMGFEQKIPDSAALRTALLSKKYVFGYPKCPELAENSMI